MSRPADRQTLLSRVDTAYQELLAQVEALDPTVRHEPGACEAWSVKDTPALNTATWERTRDDAWDDVCARLDDSRRRVNDVIASYDDAALFEKRRYRWTGSTSVGSYAVSATTSHYEWATRLIRRFAKSRTA